MLKLNASFSKKVPAEGEYSSKSYHAAIEVELPDGLSDNQLKDKIHNTFELVRASVEAEIGGTKVTDSDTRQQSTPNRYSQAKRAPVNKQDTAPASPKQLSYLLDLTRTLGYKPGEIIDRAGVDDLSQLTRTQCSRLIDEFNGKTKAA
jgi:hypothetical protein